MSTPYLGQITLYSFPFPPRGWAACNGQLLPINQNQALFSLLGTTYGGDGKTHFNLPNLQTRCIVGMGNGFVEGQTGGEETHVLQTGEIPPHTHTLSGNTSSPASSNSRLPVGSSLGAAQVVPPSSSSAPEPFYPYATTAPTLTLASAAIGSVGGQPHENRMPTLGMNYCIALQGIFPSRN